MKKILITESQLQLLYEASMSIDDVYNKYYSNIDRNIFDNIINIDPFSVKNGNKTKLGNGAKWLLNLIKNNIDFDLSKAKSALLGYKIALSNKEAVELSHPTNLMQYKSVDELYNEVKVLTDVNEKPTEFGSRLEEVEYAMKDPLQTKVLYEDNDWIFVQVLSQDSAIGWGLDIDWCTAYDKELNNDRWSESHYHDYVENNNRRLFVLANKNDEKDKYQLCPESDEFKGINDKEIEFNNDDDDTINIINHFSLDILEAVYKYTKMYRFNNVLKAKHLGFDFIYNFKDGFTKVKLDKKFNFINEQGQIISNIWFDNVSNFEKGFAKVKLDGKTYFMDMKSNLYDINKNLIKNLKPNNDIYENMSTKKILITESQLANLLLEKSLEKTFGEVYSSKISKDKDTLWDLLEYSGKLMIANDNDKVYDIYYLSGLSKALGRDYVMCRLYDVMDGKNYGSTYVKPLNLFREYNASNNSYFHLK